MQTRNVTANFVPKYGSGTVAIKSCTDSPPRSKVKLLASGLHKCEDVAFVIFVLY